jgi:hypothetical protein
MEATAVLVLFLVVICGGMTLMLGAGFQSIEKERTRRVSAKRPEPAVSANALSAATGFFVTPGTSIALMPFVLDDTIVRQLEQQVRIEQAVVAQFVHHPSVDSLYRPTGAPLHVH